MMETRDAPVSVVIPTYNAERYLAETLASVCGQTQAPRQIVVVDDGSEDRTVEVACGFAGVTVVGIPHFGLGTALNAGVAAANEEFLAFVDADDLWLPHKLEKQLAVARQPHAPDLIFAHVASFHSPDIDEELRRRMHCPAAPQPGYAAGTLLARRGVFARVGKFDERLRIGQFIDWYNRAVERGLTHVVLPDVLLRRRLHGANMSWLSGSARADFVRLAKAALDRRRQPR